MSDQCSRQGKQQVQEPCCQCACGVFKDNKEARILGRGGGDEVRERVGEGHLCPVGHLGALVLSLSEMQSTRHS